MTRTSENIAVWCRGAWVGPKPPAAFPCVFHDTRRAVQGGLYVAIRGERFDGHDFIERAVEAGASAAVVCRDYAAVHSDSAHPFLVVDDTRRALMDMAAGYRRTLRGTIIGISGSVGKTTVKEMLADVLARAGRVTRTSGNWNNDLGLPLSILSMQAEDKFGVFEAGINHPGEMKALAEILQPDWAVMTVVGAAHLGLFESEEQIAREKAELFRALPAGGTAVMDVDQPWADLMLAMTSCRRLTVSGKGRKDTDYSLVEMGSRHALCLYDRARNTTISCAMPLPGRHIMQDALLALGAGLSLGVNPDDACAAIAAFKPVGMRWQVEQVGTFQVVNDAYNANPLSMRAALAAFAEWPVEGRKWIVLGAMRELGASETREHIELGSALAHGPWNGLVTVGDSGNWIADGAARAGFPSNRIFRCADTNTAARALMQNRLASGDAVLLKASRSEKMETVLSVLREEYSTSGKG